MPVRELLKLSHTGLLVVALGKTPEFKELGADYLHKCQSVQWSQGCRTLDISGGSEKIGTTSASRVPVLDTFFGS